MAAEASSLCGDNTDEAPEHLPGDAPLTKFRIVGINQNWYQAPDAPKQPGGSCWHCGTGIANEVIIEDTATHEKHTIGTTCAERVGLDKKALKAMLADKYAEERWERSKAQRDARRAVWEAWEDEQTALYGPHGTEPRYWAGKCHMGDTWPCQECQDAAPHGTKDRFHNGKCRCLSCIDAVVEDGRYATQEERRLLVSLKTGRIADAKVVSTRYGSRWCVENGQDWLPVSPKRRATLANKGYVEAEAPYLVEVCGSRHGGRQWFEPLQPLGDPIVDAWGEPVPRPKPAAS